MADLTPEERAGRYNDLIERLAAHVQSADIAGFGSTVDSEAAAEAILEDRGLLHDLAALDREVPDDH